jgi:hypothetical protein
MPRANHNALGASPEFWDAVGRFLDRVGSDT